MDHPFYFVPDAQISPAATAFISAAVTLNTTYVTTGGTPATALSS